MFVSKCTTPFKWHLQFVDECGRLFIYFFSWIDANKAQICQKERKKQFYVRLSSVRPVKDFSFCFELTVCDVITKPELKPVSGESGDEYV